MLKMVVRLVFITFFILSFKNIEAQRFKAAVVIGANASQLDGDNSAGFNKLGLTGGLKVNTFLSEKMGLSTEILFSQRGSKTDLISGNYLQSIIHLNYMEVPLAFSYKDWLDEDGYYRLLATAGFSYGKLFNPKTDLSPYDSEISNFSKDDVSFLIGASFFTSEKFCFTFRYTRSILRLYKNEKYNHGLNSLIGYFLTFRGEYYF